MQRMIPDDAMNPFVARHRQKLKASFRHGGRLLLFGVLVLGGTVGPTFLLGWETMVPAAIGAAIFALLSFSAMVFLPLEFIAYLSVYYDRQLDGLPARELRFGRALFRESGRLEAMAREAGLPPLSDFESPDVLDTGVNPQWHRPETALPTLDHLLARVEPGGALHRDLEYLRAALQVAKEKDAQFYLLLLTWSGFTNAHVEARRRGEPL